MRSQSYKSLHRERKNSYFSLALLVLSCGILVSWYLDPSFWSDSNLSKLGKDFIRKVVKKIIKRPQTKIKPILKNKDTIHDTISDTNLKLIMTYKSIKTFETALKKREGGGFMIRRAVGDKIDSVDPFLMLDHLGPTVYGPGEALGAPDHPHRGFETVTYVIDGMSLLFNLFVILFFVAVSFMIK